MSRDVGELKKVLDEFGDECPVCCEHNGLYVRLYVHEDGVWHPVDAFCERGDFNEEERC